MYPATWQGKPLPRCGRTNFANSGWKCGRRRRRSVPWPPLHLNAGSCHNHALGSSGHTSSQSSPLLMWCCMSVFSCVWRQGAIGGGARAAQRAGSSEWQVELGVVDLWLCSPSVIDNNTATSGGTSSLQQHSTYFKHVAFIQDGCKQAIASGWRCYRSMLWPPGPCHRICCRAASVRYAAEALLLKCGSEWVFVVFEAVVPSSGGPALEAFFEGVVGCSPGFSILPFALRQVATECIGGCGERGILGNAEHGAHLPWPHHAPHCLDLERAPTRRAHAGTSV